MKQKSFLFFENKGNIRILLRLYSNDKSIKSKYELVKITNIARNTIEIRLQELKKYDLVKVIKERSPRNPTLIKLTKKGVDFSNLLIKSLDLLESEV
jgi:DNA-binding HxlR family transcriptional regulator